ncbi:MAG: hypothetical protein A2020_10445 [Lentisphaerae bacterium GWF2_45_14]|nr:MAG: hypothetical protein A2020_10445 [Lentisphaerae bacterium GWF2_45_14]
MKENNRNIHILVIAAFFIFAFMHAYLFVCDSYNMFTTDITFQGSIFYSEVYPQTFSNDPVMKDICTVYLPVQKFLCESIMKLGGSYSFALKTLLFIYSFFSMLATYFALNVFFPKTKPLVLAGFTALIALVFINLAKEASGIFYGIGASYARTTAAIYTPLLAAYYFKGKDLRIFNFSLPKMIAFAIFCGIAGNFHPRIALMMLSTGTIHYFLYHWKDRKTWIVLPIAGIAAGIAVSPCYISLAAQTAGKGFFEFLMHPTSVDLKNAAIPGATPAASAGALERISTFLSQVIFSLRNDLCYWLWKATFPLYVIPFIAVLFFWKISAGFSKSNDTLYRHIRDMFVIAFVSMVVLEFVSRIGGLFWSPLGELLGGIYFRGEKVVFLYCELLAVFFILNRRELEIPKIMHFMISASIVFCLVFSAGARFILIKNSFLCFGGDFLKVTVIFRCLSILATVIVVLLFLKSGLKNKAAQWLVTAYFCLTFLIWPFISGGVISAIGSFCDNFERIGAWKMVSMVYHGSSAAEQIKNFNSMVEFAKKDSSSSDVFMTLTSKNTGHHFKLATIRKGIGDHGEYGNKALRREITSFYTFVKAPGNPANQAKFKDSIDKYGITYILLEKSIGESLPLAEQISFKEVFQNPEYIIYKQVK